MYSIYFTNLILNIDLYPILISNSKGSFQQGVGHGIIINYILFTSFSQQAVQ